MKKDRVFNVVSRINYEDGILYGSGDEVLTPGDVVVFNNKEKAIVTNNKNTLMGRELVTLVLLGRAEERFKNDYLSYMYLCSVNNIDNVSTSELAKAKIKTMINVIISNDSINIEDIVNKLFVNKTPIVPMGFIYCKDEKHLGDILMVNNISIDNTVLHIRQFPCLLTINRDTENKRTNVYSLSIDDFKELEEYL